MCHHFFLSKLRHNTIFVSSSYMFLDKKALLKIWLNPGPGVLILGKLDVIDSAVICSSVWAGWIVKVHFPFLFMEAGLVNAGTRCPDQ